MEVGVGSAIRRSVVAGALLALAFPAFAGARVGDAYVADDGSSSILRITPGGAVSTVLSGPPLSDPMGIAFGPDGMLYVADDDVSVNGAVFRVNPATGSATTVKAGAPFVEPTGITVLPNGLIIVADEDSAPTTGAIVTLTRGGTMTPIASGPPFTDPYDVDLLPSGNLLVADDGAGGPGTIFTVNRATGAVSPFSSGPLLDHPQALVRRADGTSFAVDTDIDGGGPDVMQIVRITRSGAASLRFSGPPLNDSSGGIALDLQGRLLISDASGAAVYRMRIASGPPVPLASGGLVTGPAGIAVQPPRCAGRSATEYGSPFRERLRGTPMADVQHALAGPDVLTPGRGADRACGGPGKDVLRGGPGRDRLFGQGKRDRLYGGKGRDLLKGGRGFDICVGGPGRDRYRGCEVIRP